VIITIMVLEIKAPKSPELASFRLLLPVFTSYILSFVFIGIYWTNHHHLFHAVQKVNGKILWANLHLLFWLSVVPFLTNWMGENSDSPWPVAVYGMALLGSGVAYSMLTQILIRHHGESSTLSNALGKDSKGKISILLYILAVPLAFVSVWLSYALYSAVALMWLKPDQRIERTVPRLS